MDPLIIVIIFAVAAAAIAFVLLFLHMNRRKMERSGRERQENSRRAGNAVWGKALVTGVRGGTSGEMAETARVTVTMEVMPPGGKPYRATAAWLVDMPNIGFVQQGQEISVKIDAEDPGIIYPNFPGARYLGG